MNRRRIERSGANRPWSARLFGMEARIQEPADLIGVVVGTGRPRPFGQLHVVVGQQRSLFTVEVANGQVVIRQRAIEVGGTRNDLTLCLQQEVDRVASLFVANAQDIDLIQIR